MGATKTAKGKTQAKKVRKQPLSAKQRMAIFMKLAANKQAKKEQDTNVKQIEEDTVKEEQ